MSREKANRTQSRGRNIFSRYLSGQRPVTGGTFAFAFKKVVRGHRHRFLFPLKWPNNQGPVTLPSRQLLVRFHRYNGCLFIMEGGYAPPGSRGNRCHRFLLDGETVFLVKRVASFEARAAFQDVAPGVITSQRTVTNCAKTIKECDSSS